MPDIDTRNVVTVTDRASLDNTVAVMDLGAVGFNPRGEYSHGETYSLLDLVQWNGKGWICKSVAGTQVEPSESATDEWMLWANNGSEGLLDAAVAAKEAAEAAQRLAQANQTASETAKTQAETAKTQAETARSQAQTAAGTATTKASESAESAKKAEQSNQSAADQASNAEASAEAAKGSADKASNSANTANTAAQTATSKAQEAADSALEASNSVGDANKAANTATTKAQEAADSAAEAKAAAGAAATEAAEEAAQIAAEKAATEAAEKAATEAAEKAAQGIEDHPPKISDSGTWEVYNPSQQAYADTGTQARGEDGADGKDATINGVNAITIEAGSNVKVTTGTAKVTISAQVSTSWTVSLKAASWAAGTDNFAGIYAQYKQQVTCAGMTADTDITSIQFAGGDFSACAAYQWYVRPGSGAATFWSPGKPAADFEVKLVSVNK